MPKKKNSFVPAGSGQIESFVEKIVKNWECVVPGVEIEKYDSGLKSISTGSTKLDWALTHPLTEGTINEIHGPNGTGKTTMALEVAANATLMGKPVFFFDLERKLSYSQIAMIPRLDKKLFCRVRPSTGEDAVNKVNQCVSDVPGCVVIFDSLTQLLPEVEDGEGAEKQSMGIVARLAAKMIRKILGPVERNRCMVLFISHETANMSMYSGEVKTKGGKAVPDAAAQRIRLKNLAAGKIKDDKGNIIGQNVKCKIVKNNQGVPFREVEVPIIFGRGIERSLDLLQIAVELSIIERPKGSSWYTYTYNGQDHKAQQTDMLELIRENKEFRTGLVKQVNEIL